MASRDVAQGGFTLIEIVVAMALVSILAGAMAPLAAGQLKGQRIRTTHERMERVVEALAGPIDGRSYGYLGDMGRLPARLDDLNERGKQPEFQTDPVDGIGTGFNGPYVPLAGPSGSAFQDAWGTPFDYRAGVARVTSAGSDRAFGSADDLVFPDVPAAITGNVSVSVVGIPNDGAPGCLLSEDEAEVRLAIARDGRRKEIRLRGSSGVGGPFSETDVHRGFHGVRLEGRGPFAGAAARDVVELRGSNAHLRATLLQPAGPPPACREGT